jgi:Ca-activated chloride channel family protein
MELSALQSFHFLYPAWLIALVPLWASVAWIALRHARDGSWSQVIDADLLPAMRLEGGQRGSAPWWVFAVVWTLATLALAGPAWQREESPAFRSPHDWIVLLDLSPSMDARDVTPDRVTRARYVIEDILSAAQDARVGLIVFAGDSHALTPLTSDVETVRALLKPLAPDIMPAAGDLLAPALDETASLLKSVASRDAQIIVLTDGFSDPSAALKSAGQLRAQGANIHVIGIGSASGAPAPDDKGSFARDAQGRPVLAKLPTDLLQHLAAAGGGDYTGVSGARQLIASMQAHRSDKNLAGEKVSDVELNTWRNEGIWLLPPLLLLAALIARRGWV